MEKHPFEQMHEEAERNKEKNSSPSDFFKKNPKVEHVLYKTKKNPKEPIRDVTRWHGAHDIVPDYKKTSDLYLRSGEKPYTFIHNHPSGSENLGLEDDRCSMPSPGDLEYFLMDDEVETAATYQHNPLTNETEGMFVIRKTEKTPKTGIKLSTMAKECKTLKDAEIKIAENYGELYNSFMLPTKEIFKDYFNLTMNPQHSKIPNKERPVERQRMLDEIAKELHLQIKYIPAEGYYYSSGIGFLKKKESQ